MISLELKKRLHASNGDLNLDIKLEIPAGQIVCLFGDSGSGKTSILRMISGLMEPDEGIIIKNGQTLFSSKERLNMDVQKRNIGFLFQDYALFPNMTVFQNLNYALKKYESQNLIWETLELLGLNELAHKKPDKLSGGQKQRVALGRSLVNRPEVLLLDEPLSALDRNMRQQLQNYILQIRREFNLSMILVTHDISEALRLADEVHVLEGGKIKRSGKAEHVFTQNNISGKFQFSGEIIRIEVQGFISILHILIENQFTKIIYDNKDDELKVGDKVIIASKAFNPIITKI